MLFNRRSKCVTVNRERFKERHCHGLPFVAVIMRDGVPERAVCIFYS